MRSLHRFSATASSCRSLAALVLLLAGCNGLLSGPLAAQDQTEGVRPPKLNYTTHNLENGLQVILLENHEVPIINLQIWYHVGAKDERPGRTGFALVRALDVQRFGARACRGTFAHHRSRGRIRQRRNQRRHHPFLRDISQQLS